MAKLENIELIDKMIKAKYLNVQRHPNADIYLYNYSPMCAIDKVWNDITMVCRGMVCDSDYNILARPFPKFFNYEEHADPSVIPNLPFEIYEKLDGSLGIMYWINDVPYITTRGSFVSEQGIHATKVLHERYSQYFDKLDKTKTYLFEIIYPEDHKVVSYGTLDDIFLLAVIDTATGEESDIYEWENIFKCTKKYDGIDNFLEIRNMFSGDNKEGFVVKFSNNFRIKLKFEEYFRIAFVMNHFSKKVVLDYLVDGKKSELDEIMDSLNEENQIYYNQTVDEFKEMYSSIENQCKDYYREFDTDKEAAEYFLKFKYSGILFKMRKNSPYESTIWNYVKKEFKSNQK